MRDPYLTLGIPELVSDEEVSAAYHKKLRQFPPEDYPDEFSQISEAIEQIRTEADRIDLRLFAPPFDTQRLTELAEGEACEAPTADRAVWTAAAVRAWSLGRAE